MSWIAHKVVLRLRSPMHIGAGKVGNLQRTRPYVAGRNLWGALTARLTRNDDSEGKPHPKKYQEVGCRVHKELAFTYFFPTVDGDGDKPLFPHLDTRGSWGYGRDGNGTPRMGAAAFQYRFLSTYASTALDYTAQSAQEASLHEVECLTHHTRDNEQVYLTGYVFQREGADLDWQGALTRLQVGGERGYGWGRVEVVHSDGIREIQGGGVPLFGTGHVALLDGPHGFIRLAEGQPVLAHALAAPFKDPVCCDDDEPPVVRGKVAHIRGEVEPLVGRETTQKGRFGVRLSRARICYAPGARVEESITVQIGPYGVWEGAP